MNQCCKLIAKRIKTTTKVTFFAMVTVQILLVCSGKYKAKNFSIPMTATRQDEHGNENKNKKYINLQSSQA